MTSEQLYDNDRTRVDRVIAADGSGTVIRKEPRGPDGARRCAHEVSILTRLAGVAGIPRLHPGYDHREAIFLVDSGGEPLATRLLAGPVDPDELIAFAAELAGILAALHRNGVVHRDVNPRNVLVGDQLQRPVLIDYDLATTFAVERPSFTHHRDIVGTLAYLAPEQTGRTGWPVDQRADLYGLGATLYELATGAPPFGDGDPLRLTHDHLTRVPTPPTELRPEVPAGLSAIIGHLLEKEPDRRYQSAEGVQHDLRRLRDERAQGQTSTFTPGERDFPWRLTPPARLVGREREIAVLGGALTGAITGQDRALLVSGAPGVGKTALIDELRPLVTAAEGWFVSGKFDPHRQDAGSDALRQALRGLGRMLLAEPEVRLGVARSRLLEAAGANAGLLAAVVPEFRTLLDVAPEDEIGDPVQAQLRVQQSALAALRAVASPDRPVVIVLDDLQWAGTVHIGFIDAVLGDENLRGVLVVGAYRESEVDATHPLAVSMDRWRGLPHPVPHLRLNNLPAADVAVLLAGMLRVPVPDTDDLAVAIGARTGGNPFDTVEFVNALRRDGVLTPSDDGWNWSPEAVRQHLGHGDVTRLLAKRIEALPESTQDLLATMSCLGGDVGLDLLHAAAAADPEPLLVPALEDGLLIMERGTTESVRFRHDRVQQAVYDNLSIEDRGARRLAIGRRLAGIAGFGVIAAEQYLHELADLTDPAELARVVQLSREAAAHARRLANYPVAERFLAAAVGLLDRPGTIGVAGLDPATGARLRLELAVEWHAALFGLGRHDEADQVYERIAQGNDPLLRAEATWVQVLSLTLRGRPADGLQLGLTVLADLGHAAPPEEDLAAEIDRGMDELQRWVATGSAAKDAERVDVIDPRTAAVAKIVNRLIPASYFSGSPLMAWLVTAAVKLWERYGPSAALVGPIANAAFVTIGLRRDYRTGYLAVRRVLDVSEARGYEPETSQVRTLYALSAGPWFEPLEHIMREAQRAHEGLIRSGDLVNAGFTFYASVCEGVNCSPTLEHLLAEVHAGLAFTARTGDIHTTAFLLVYRQTVRALRGETDAVGSFGDASFDDEAHLQGLTYNPTAAGNYHLMRALMAAIFNDQAALTNHSATALLYLPAYEGTPATTFAYLLRAMALVRQLQAGTPESAAEFGEHRDWIAARAAESPGNFLHLRHLLDAEHAWATGDFEEAVRTFDLAQREVQSRQRPWQRALIAERRGRFLLANDIEYGGRLALHEARRSYLAWGATAKVAQLEQEYPFLLAVTEPAMHSSGGSIDPRRSSGISSQMIDMMAVLRASQALSSETSLDRLQDRVVELMCALTGATQALMLLRDGDEWYLPHSDHDERRMIPVAQAAATGQLPLSVFRYAERTQEPLLVDDATRDDRFARDPYLRDLPGCALLVVPIQTRGRLSAMLLLENRRSRGAFGANRLDTVLLIAGQLSVSLDNALTYAELENRVAERTEELKAANDQLELLSVTDPLTGLPNRRRLTEALDAAWQHAAHTGKPVAVAMIDIDQFKVYNDHYGHPAGDECLRQVAATVRRSLRDTDLVARYGGEEFAVVLPGAGAAEAAMVTERIRAAVADLAMPHERAGHGFVTISIGVATTAGCHMGTAEQLIKTADAQLYEAKHGGRNQVVVAPANT